VNESPRGPVDDDVEPDYRFSLANERTFLAWVRTSVALFAGGVGVIGVANKFSTSPGRSALGCALLLLGALAAGTAYSRWRRSDEAMRAGAPLPRTPMLLILGIGMAVVGLLAIALAVEQIV
jgi:putative membrane protein